MTRIALFMFVPALGFAGVGEPSVMEDESTPSGFQLLDLFAGIQRFDADLDFLDSSDVSVWKSTYAYSQERSDWAVETSFAYTDFSVDYTDPVGSTLPESRNEETWEGSLTLGAILNPALTVNVSGRFYNGYSDFQSVWISEYYDQFIGIPFRDTYTRSDPHGWGLTLGAVWDYKPGVGRVTVNLGYGRDQIVPAWSAVPNPDNFFIPEGQRTRNRLDTYSGSVVWEYALSPSLKTQLTGRVAEITARDTRFQLQSDWAWAVSSNVTVRGQVGGTSESPDFEAFYGGLSMDWEIAPSWHLGVGARAYTDTGEVVAAGFNTAAPGLDSNELTVSLAWEGQETTVRLSTGIFETEYDALSDSNQFFANLYRDRDYTIARIAVSRRF